MPLLHFSENPDISIFHPRPTAGKDDPTPVIWAIDAAHAFLYYLPRDCPRVVYWPLPESTDADIQQFCGHSAAKAIVAVEGMWLERINAARLYVYQLPQESFAPVVPESDSGFHGVYLSQETVTPLSVAPVGDLLTALRDAEIEVRITPTLWPLWEAVAASTLHFSGIRLRNALPRPEA